ncbi:MFS transporter [Acetonema longum]|uniref:Putative permease n=1 Tax=Acetonema longum DSM 6540 TaxID=1009370 RepID=F7NGG6_9FIRM|nr:MFS transporter [Acetonema longum]EGO64770.1 putative permease [Acetonema longum DSM 6540]
MSTQTTPGVNPIQPTKGRVMLVLILFFTLMVAYLDRVNVSVLVADPTFLGDMGIKDQPVRMGLLMTLFLIAYGVANVVTGPLGDYMGPRKAMALSILLWAVAVLLGGMATSFAVMLAARVVLGIGEGMHWPMQSSFVKSWFPPAERGKANSVWLLGLMVGPAVAMPVLAAIVAETGWRFSFYMLGALGMVPLLLIWYFTADRPRDSKMVNQAELDYIETALKAEAEAEAAAPVTSLAERLKSFIYNYRFWLVTFNYFVIACIWWGMMAWLPSYLKVARGFSWSQMGALSALPYVMGTLSVLLVGHLSDRLGRKAPFMAIGHFGAAVFIYLGAVAADNWTSAIYLSLGIALIGGALPPSWSLLQLIVPGKAVGAGAGMMNGLSNGGSAFSPVLIGWFISLSGSYFGGLLFLVSLAVLAGLAMLVLSWQKY